MARFFFHLMDSSNVLRDELGVDANDLAAAHRAAVEVIEEFKLEQPQADWHDWKLVVSEENSPMSLIVPLVP